MPGLLPGGALWHNYGVKAPPPPPRAPAPPPVATSTGGAGASGGRLDPRDASSIAFNRSLGAQDQLAGISGTMLGAADKFAGQRGARIDMDPAIGTYRGTVANFYNARDALLGEARNDASVGYLNQLAQGQGPAATAAQAQLNSGLNAANAAAASRANSARGGAGALALANRAAMAQQATNNVNAANQAAALKAGMQMQGIQGLSQQRAQNLGMMTDLAKLQAQITTGMAHDYATSATNQAQLNNNFDLGKFVATQGSRANAGGLLGTGVAGTVNAANAASTAQNAGTNARATDANISNQDINTVLGGVQSAGLLLDTGAKWWKEQNKQPLTSPDPTDTYTYA